MVRTWYYELDQRYPGGSTAMTPTVASAPS
jgi:hypothetical protein